MQNSPQEGRPKAGVCLEVSIPQNLISYLSTKT
jgi:hypothetical protein